MPGRINNRSSKITVRDICFMGVMVCLIVIQETALSFIPNFNFTHLAIALTFYLIGLPKTLIVVLCYTLLDNLIMGSFNLAYAPTIIIMWLLYPIMLYIFSKIFKSNRLMPAIVSAIHALFYSWAFVLVFTVFYNIPFKAYLIADIPYELILIATAFVTVFLLLPRLIKIFDQFIFKRSFKGDNNNIK